MPALADFRVEISGVGATQIPIGIAPFRDDAGGVADVAGIISADLERSGLFRSLPVEGRFDERSTLDLALWRSRGADAMARAALSTASARSSTMRRVCYSIRPPPGKLPEAPVALASAGLSETAAGRRGAMFRRS